MMRQAEGKWLRQQCEYRDGVFTHLSPLKVYLELYSSINQFNFSIILQSSVQQDTSARKKHNLL